MKCYKAVKELTTLPREFKKLSQKWQIKKDT